MTTVDRPIEVLPGIHIRMLRVGEDGAGYTMMMRAEPGATLPWHSHLDDVHAITHRGRWRYDDYEYYRAFVEASRTPS